MVTHPHGGLQQPDNSVGDKFEPAQLLGKLLLIYPTQYKPSIQTQNFGERDGVEADVIVLDAPGEPLVLKNTMLFPGVLVRQTKTRVGGMVLGRLIQGAPTGKGVPWMLADYTEQEAAQAMQYINAHPRNAPEQPSATTPPPAPATTQGGWGALPANGNGAPSAAGYGVPAGPPVQSAPAPAPVSQLSPALVEFLVSKGLDRAQVQAMAPDQAQLIAASFPA
jgi:hypothetical protein